MGQWDPRTGTFGNEMNPFIKANQSGIMGLGAYGQNPLIQNGGGRQPPPPGGWPPQNIQDILGFNEPRVSIGGGPRNWPPKGNLWPGHPIQSPQHGFNQFGEQLTGFGEQLGGYEEQMGGFGEQLGGYKDLLSGFGEKFSGFGEQLGGFKDQFSNINDKLQSMEQGITSLTDKFGTQQQQQSPYQQNFGMNPFGSINPYTPFFGGLGMFMRRY